MEITNTDVLNMLFEGMQEQHRAILCSVPGDPNTADKRAWTGIPWAAGTACPLRPDWNNYVAVSSFKADPDGRFGRRKADFGALHCLMLDDIGTKISTDDVKAFIKLGFPPALTVQTSPGNGQAVFVFDKPVTDYEEADGLIRAAITYFMGDEGADPGMSGVTRVFRLPQGINGKGKYMSEAGAPYRCQVFHWEPHRRINVVNLRATLQAVTKKSSYVEPNDEVTRERRRSFEIVRQGLQVLRAIKKQGRGWLEIRCPWVGEHTDRADSGAAVAFPAPKNGFIGGYRCHHGHCAHRGWTDLENWVADELALDASRTTGTFTGLIKK